MRSVGHESPCGTGRTPRDALRFGALKESPRTNRACLGARTCGRSSGLLPTSREHRNDRGHAASPRPPTRRRSDRRGFRRRGGRPGSGSEGSCASHRRPDGCVRGCPNRLTTRGRPPRPPRERRPFEEVGCAVVPRGCCHTAGGTMSFTPGSQINESTGSPLGPAVRRVNAVRRGRLRAS